MEQGDEFAVGTFDVGYDHIAFGKIEALKMFGLLRMLCDPVLQTAGFAGHGGQREHAVTLVEIQIFCDGTQFVGGIEFAVPVHVVRQTVMPVLFAQTDLIPQIVTVSAFRMNELAEQSLLRHIEDRQLMASVTAVLHEHAGHPCLFRGPDQLPALLDAGGAAHFHGGIESGVHGIQTDLHVGGPAGRRQNGVQALDLQQRAVVRGDNGLFSARLQNGLRGGFGAVGIKVADADHLDVIHFQEEREDSGRPGSVSDHGDFHFFELPTIHFQNPFRLYVAGKTLQSSDNVIY